MTQFEMDFEVDDCEIPLDLHSDPDDPRSNVPWFKGNSHHHLINKWLNITCVTYNSILINLNLKKFLAFFL